MSWEPCAPPHFSIFYRLTARAATILKGCLAYAGVVRPTARTAPRRMSNLHIAAPPTLRIVKGKVQWLHEQTHEGPVPSETRGVRKVWIAVLVGAILSLVAACGGSSSSQTSGSTGES